MWSTSGEFTSSNQRLRVSLMSPLEESELDFLDLRRVFEKKGVILPTKRGIRIPITSLQLVRLAETIGSINRGQKTSCETAGLSLIRRNNALYIRRVFAQEDGKNSVLLVLSPIEVDFLLNKLGLLSDIFIARVEEEDEFAWL